MTKSEFIHGVLFHLPGSNGHQVFRLHDIDDECQVIRRHGFICDSGYLMTVNAYEYHTFHVRIIRKIGIQLWTAADTVYLDSKTFPFSALTKVEQPTPSVPVIESQTIHESTT